MICHSKFTAYPHSAAGLLAASGYNKHMNEEKIKTATYSTSDLSLAAFLAYQNFRVLRVDKADHFGKARNNWVFNVKNGSKKLEKQIENFNQQKTKVEPVRFMSTRANLKRLLWT